MYPVLLTWGPVSLHTFGLLLALAFGVGFAWAHHRVKQKDRPEIIVMLAPWLMLGALIGARVLYLVFFPQQFQKDPLGAVLSSGGLVWYGGVAGAVLAVMTVAKIQRVPVLQLGDVLMPPVAVGLAIGRLGCLMAGCCYGSPCTLPWAIYYPAGHETHPWGVHPVPLYEGLGALLLAWLLLRMEQCFQRPGITTAVFLMGYGLLRFGLETLRGDRLVVGAENGLSASQWLSLLAVLAGGLIWVRQGFLGQQGAQNQQAKS